MPPFLYFYFFFLEENDALVYLLFGFCYLEIIWEFDILIILHCQ